MAFNLFSKNKKEETKKKAGTPTRSVGVKPAKVEVAEKSTDQAKSVAFGDSHGAYKVLSNLYMSEKSSLLSQMGQYVFEVSKISNKSEIKKHIEKLYNVKVKDVKVLNMPEKRRDIGRHPGVKAGHRKAIVILQKGYVIEQVNP